jgi:CRP-like cAMP-binding protein
LDAFKQYIETYVSIPDEDWKIILPAFKRKEIQKNELILEEGNVCKHLYFLETGLLHFFINKDGDEVTKFFTIAPYFFTSQASLYAQKPAKESIQAIEKSVVWEITYEEVQKLLKLNSWSNFARKITQEVQYFTEEILEALQTETAENRYLKILETQPELLQRIPLKYLASYLGIAPQSLSRIRKKIVKKNRS